MAMALTLVASLARAQPADGGRPALITVADLVPLLDRSDVVLLHVSDEAHYRAGHIRGARHVTPMMLSTPSGEGRLTLELPPDDELRARFMALGIGDASTVVVYYADDWMSQATRVVFTLDATGLGGRTRLLDGGFAAWQAGKQAVSEATVSPTPATALTLARRAGVVVSLDDVKAITTSQSGVRLVDARMQDFHAGTNDRRGQIPRPGHIPGAINMPYLSFFERGPGSDGTQQPMRLRPEAELQAMFVAAGLTPGTPLVTYCHIGQQATVPFFVARMLGYDVRLYDGSFDEWSATTSVPVATASDQKK